MKEEYGSKKIRVLETHYINISYFNGRWSCAQSQSVWWIDAQLVVYFQGQGLSRLRSTVALTGVSSHYAHLHSGS